MKLSIYITAVIFALASQGCIKQKDFKKIQVAWVDNPVISLNGTWKFTMTPPGMFWQKDIDFKDWSDIQVPGECQMQGFAIKHDQPYVYKRAIDVPSDYSGKEIRLNFYGVYSYARVWVNGEFIREYHGGFTKWSCDISDFVTAGQTAFLTVEIVNRSDDISFRSGYAKHQIGGISLNFSKLLKINDLRGFFILRSMNQMMN